MKKAKEVEKDKKFLVLIVESPIIRRSGNAGQRNFQSGGGRQHRGPQRGSDQGQKNPDQNRNVRFGAIVVDPEKDVVMYDQIE